MKVRLWGTRGSLASPGAETARYGGNTSCVEVRGDAGTLLVLDAGSGVRRLGRDVPRGIGRLDVLLTHLHMDHIQGLGFFDPLHWSDTDVHIWGPASASLGLRERLQRYLSPPLFPVRLRDLGCRLTLHEVSPEEVEIGEFRIRTSFICHPGPTVGYRIEDGLGTLAFLSDHEPALAWGDAPGSPDWTSGYSLAEDVDLLIHDGQYTAAEYADRVGWGHSAIGDTVAFARHTGARRLVPYHHDPSHDDRQLDRMVDEARAAAGPRCEVLPGREGDSFVVARR
jgi:phosphoribosyl 1,2-cyclic phosphodiesterase